MTDQEKIMSWLEGLSQDDWHQFHSDSEVSNIAKAALALLKEKEPKEVKDKSKRIKFLDEYFEGECPFCRSFLDEHSNRNFCGYCGKAVKWE